MGHSGYVMGVALSLDNSHIVSVSRDKTARVWDTASGSLVQLLEGHTAPIYGVAVSTDGQTILSSSADTTIRIWNPAGVCQRVLKRVSATARQLLTWNVNVSNKLSKKLNKSTLLMLMQRSSKLHPAWG